jgi:Class III cytochrome C family
MKLTIVLMAVLGYSTLLLTNAAPQKSGKKPPAKPTPTPVVKKTPATTAAPPAPPVQPTATPTANPSPTATATPPVVLPSPAPTGPGTVAATSTSRVKEACENQPAPSAKNVPQLTPLLLCSIEQPVKVVLNTDPKTTSANGKLKVPFNHLNHATKNYSIDGRSVIDCAECHHTDQPATALKGLYKTSLRDTLLTTAALKEANAKPVSTCRACHAQAGLKPINTMFAEIPPDKNEEKRDSDTSLLTNEVAYHRNCIDCHSDANAAPGRTPKAKAPTSCSSCHTGKTE